MQNCSHPAEGAALRFFCFCWPFTRIFATEVCNCCILDTILYTTLGAECSILFILVQNTMYSTQFEHMHIRQLNQ